jgi:nucleotide-binding universal stress UspA family protein
LLLDTYLVDDFPLESTIRIVRSGDPAAEIVQAAHEIRATLIIMPTHAGVFRNALLGSTTAKVLNNAACPVLTSRHAETIAPRPIEHREWLCAIGLAADSERVLRCAYEVTSQARGHLSIIHAIQMNQLDLPLEFSLSGTVESAAREQAHRSIAELKQAVGIEAEIRISLGNVKDALLDAAREFDADVLMIGRSAHLGPMGRLRDLTYAVVRDSPFPVLSV